MKYLRSEELKKLSPVKRQVYERRKVRERERISEELGGIPKVPVFLPVFGKTIWVNNTHLTTMHWASVAAIQKNDALQQFLEAYYNGES